jgi:hypothetical protein
VNSLRIAAGILAGITAAALVAIAWVLLVAPPRVALAGLVGDDAGYYFAVARNVCLGFGLSFDRLHATNGFNPLFLWLLIGAYRLLPQDLPVLACYRAGLLVDWLVALGAFAFFVRLVAGFMDRAVFRGDVRRLALAACAAFYGLFVCAKSQYGMDAPLVLLIGNAYLDRVQRRGLVARGGFRAALDGLLLGLLFLARVDSLPLVLAAFGLMAASALRDRSALRGVAARAAACALVVSPYVAWGQMRFGTWMPVSARIKSSFPHLDPVASLAAIRSSSLPNVDQLGFLAALIVSLGAIAWLQRRVARGGLAALPTDGPSQVLAVLSLYLAARLTFMLLFSRHDVQGGYGVLAHVFNVLVLLRGIEALTRWRGRGRSPLPRRFAIVASVALALVSLVLATAKVRTLVARGERIASEGSLDDAAFGDEVRRHTPPTAVIYGGAFGLAGLFSDRAWINGDGVANTYEYQVALARDELRDYLRRNRVSHVVLTVDPDSLRRAAPLRLDVMGFVSGRASSIDLDSRNVVLVTRVARGASRPMALVRFEP